MTEDPHGRPWQPAPVWQPDHPDPYGPPPQAPSGQAPSGQAPFGQGPPHPPPYPGGGPETRQYPAGPPGSAPPHGGFSWRDGDAPPPQPQGPPIGRILAIIGAILALLAAAVAAYFLLLPRLTAARSQPAPTVAAPPAPAPAPVPPAATVAPAPGPLALTAAADCVSPPSKDAAGTVVDYGPEKMVDGRVDTAWRCDGDGAGKTVRVTFDRSARVTQVGIVPGYAKTDPADGTDRYAQNRRIAQVRYTFDNGTTVDQTLNTAATNRSVQTVPVPNVTSSGMTITIVRSVPGSTVGPNAASDRVAVSEVSVVAG